MPPESRLIREQRERRADREADALAAAFTELLLAALEEPRVRAAVRSIAQPPTTPKPPRGRGHR